MGKKLHLWLKVDDGGPRIPESYTRFRVDMNGYPSDDLQCIQDSIGFSLWDNGKPIAKLTGYDYENKCLYGEIIDSYADGYSERLIGMERQCRRPIDLTLIFEEGEEDVPAK